MAGQEAPRRRHPAEGFDRAFDETPPDQTFLPAIAATGSNAPDIRNSPWISGALFSGKLLDQAAFFQQQLNVGAAEVRGVGNACVIAAAAGNFKWFFAFPSNLIKNGF